MRRSCGKCRKSIDVMNYWINCELFILGIPFAEELIIVNFILNDDGIMSIGVAVLPVGNIFRYTVLC